MSMSYNASDKEMLDIKNNVYSEGTSIRLLLKPIRPVVMDLSYTRQRSLLTTDTAPSEKTFHNMLHVKYGHELFDGARLDIRLDYRDAKGINADNRLSYTAKFIWNVSRNTTMKISHTKSSDETETIRDFSQGITFRVSRDLLLTGLYQIGFRSNSKEPEQTVYLTLTKSF